MLSLQQEVHSSGDPQCFLSGSDVTLTCNIVGFPRPTIVFRKGTDVIVPGQSGFERVTNTSFNQVCIIITLVVLFYACGSILAVKGENEIAKDWCINRYGNWGLETRPPPIFEW